MGKHFISCITAVLVLGLAPFKASSEADFQIIHNSPDPDLESAVIELDFVPYELDYQEATDFNSIDAGSYQVRVAPEDAPFDTTNFVQDFQAGENYVIVVDGFREGQGGPELDINVYENARQSADQPGYVDFNAYHGVYNAPAVDVHIDSAGQVVSGLSYGEFEGYLQGLPTNVNIGFHEAGQPSPLVSFMQDLEPLEGEAITLLPSGSVNPDIQLLAVTADGDVISQEPAEEEDPAHVQLIHNSADPNIEVVDVYWNEELVESGLNFREATGFVEAEAGQGDLVLTEEGGDPEEDALASFQLAPQEGEYYTAFVHGVAEPDNFDQEVNEAIELDVYIEDDPRMDAEQDDVAFNTFHGVTDLGEVTLQEREEELALAEDLGYGSQSDYVEIEAGEYDVDVLIDGEAIYAVEADLEDYAGEALRLFASGFNDPEVNQDGVELGIFAATPQGEVVQLDETDAPTDEDNALVQIIHNAADPAAEVVDVHWKNQRAVEGLEFGNATTYAELEAGQGDLVLTPEDGDPQEDAVASFELAPQEGNYYTAFVHGVTEPENFDQEANEDIELDLYVEADPMRDADDDNVVFNTFHGVTDLGEVTLEEREEELLLAEELAYGSQSDYVQIEAAEYEVDVRVDGEAVYAVEADLEDYAGDALRLFVSGFVDPEENQEGPELGIYYATADGTVDQLEEIEVITNLFEAEQEKATDISGPYPNPAGQVTSLDIGLDQPGQVVFRVYNQRGQLVKEATEKHLAAGESTVELNLSGVEEGLHIIQIEGEGIYDSRTLFVE